MTREKPKAIDLFSGCGGLTLGLKQAGFDVLGAVEIDHLAVETYQANHPEVEVWEEDIQGLSVARVKRKLSLKEGELELLAGCPPCQGFSTMRTLNGGYEIYDERNDLISQFVKFVEGLAPKTVMMENVPGLAKDKRFRKFCRKLEELGYVINHAILDAADYGVPQRRKRLILLAGKGKRIEFAKKAARKTVADAISGMAPAGESGDALHDLPERRTKRVKRLIRKIPKDGGSRRDLPKGWQLDCHKRCDGFRDVYGRMTWGDVAPTITSGCFNPSKGRFLHPGEDRTITMREAALLQGFPRRYKFSGTDSKSAIALMIGNALPPPFVAAHAMVAYSTLMEERR